MRWSDHRRRIGAAAIGIGALSFAIVTLFHGAENHPLVDTPRDRPSSLVAPVGFPFDPRGDSLKDFVSAILGDTEAVWREQFARIMRDYKERRLVFFTGQVHTACGKVGSPLGLLYCPADEKIYIDLSFFKRWRTATNRRVTSPERTQARTRNAGTDGAEHRHRRSAGSREVSRPAI